MSFMKARPRPTASPACTMSWRAPSKMSSRAIKLMRGYHVIRRGGWDTHGLPVEIGVEKQLGFTSKAQIEAYGIAKFNELCRQIGFRVYPGMGTIHRPHRLSGWT